MSAVTFENGDASKEANMCIEAVLDENFKYSKTTGTVTCNGLKLKEFAKKYRLRMKEADETKIAVYQLEAKNNNIETQLCIAAAGGKQKMIALAREARYESYNDIQCNGISINEFARSVNK
jgi:hypothetical protein